MSHSKGAKHGFLPLALLLATAFFLPLLAQPAFAADPGHPATAFPDADVANSGNRCPGGGEVR